MFGRFARKGVSPSLGSNDPRVRQNQTASLGGSDEQVQLVESLEELEEGAEMGEICATVNKLVRIVKEDL